MIKRVEVFSYYRNLDALYKIPHTEPEDKFLKSEEYSFLRSVSQSIEVLKIKDFSAYQERIVYVATLDEKQEIMWKLKF